MCFVLYSAQPYVLHSQKKKTDFVESIIKIPFYMCTPTERCNHNLRVPDLLRSSFIKKKA